MVVLLLAFVSCTVLSGMMLYAAKDKAGPFAARNTLMLTVIPSDGVAYAHNEKAEKEHDEGGEWLKEGHEFFANVTLVLALIHIGGVLLVSLETRQNLMLSMITGRKRL